MMSNERKSAKEVIKEKLEQAKKVAKNPEVRKSVKEAWKSWNSIVDSFDINKN